MSVYGECLCGAVKVEVAAPERNTMYCRCLNCRKQSGATGTMVWIVPDDQVKITGEPKIYQDNKTDSGTPLARYFCGNCGAPIKSVTPHVPGVSVIKCGLFDAIDKPSLEMYSKNRQDWEIPLEGVRQAEAGP